MRVAFDAIRYFNNTTGLGNYSRYVIEALVQNIDNEDLELLLCTPRISQDSPDPPEGVCVVMPPRFSRNVIGRNIWRTWRLGKTAARQQARIYHGLSHEIPADAGRAGLKTVVTMHDLIYLRFPEWFSAIDRHIYDWKFRRSCARADRIVAISDQTRSDLINYYNADPEKISVVYQGCSPRFYQNVEETERQRVRKKFALPATYILQVGTLEPRKNGVMSIKALAAQSKSDIHLIFVGRRNAYRDTLEREARACGVHDRVSFLHTVESDELPALYQMAHFLSYPSLFEGFGLPVLESIAGGTPVVSSTGSCLEEAGGGGGIYVDPTSQDEMSDAFDRLLVDDSFRRDLSQAGQAHAASFTPQATACQLLELYRGLI